MKIYEKNPIDSKDVRVFKGLKGKEKERFVRIEIEGIAKEYAVSNYGRVFDVETSTELQKRSLTKSDPSYKIVRLKTIKDGKARYNSYAVNVLVANAFVKKSKKDIELKRKIVHPIDWDASNSRYSNLQWVSSVELSIMKSINDGQTEIVDFVRYACILMSHGYSDKDIKAVLDMPIKGFIAKIRKREIYPEICSKYSY